MLEYNEQINEQKKAYVISCPVIQLTPISPYLVLSEKNYKSMQINTRMV